MNGMATKFDKKLFLRMLSGSFVALLGIFWLVWKITYKGLADINGVLPDIFGGLLVFVAVFMVLSLVYLLAGMRGWYMPKIFYRQAYGMLNMMFYVVFLTGKIFNVNRRHIEASFVAVSNQIVQNRHLKVPPDRLLVVTPHCLQLATCPHKITRDPKNCHRCGGCDIGNILTMSEEMGFHFFVVTGGTLARQTVAQIRPKAVVAIACERDLASGIQDVFPIPSVGVMNIRPQGPCFNTKVNLDELRHAIEEIIDIPATGKTVSKH